MERGGERRRGFPNSSASPHRNVAVVDPELSDEVLQRFGAMSAQETIVAVLALMRPLGSPAATPAGNVELSGEEKCTIPIKTGAGERG